MNETNEFSALEGMIKAPLDGEIVDDELGEGAEDEQMLCDLQEAIILIKRAKTLIDYVGEPELCKTISKRERLSMVKLSGKLEAYVNSIESSYGEMMSHDLSV
jgi:hypothetical protein